MISSLIEPAIKDMLTDFLLGTGGRGRFENKQTTSFSAHA